MTIVYHVEADLSSWERATLGPSAESDIDEVAAHAWYSLDSVDEVADDRMFMMHRAGSVSARLSRSQFLSCGEHCYGILS